MPRSNGHLNCFYFNDTNLELFEGFPFRSLNPPKHDGEENEDQYYCKRYIALIPGEW